MENETKTFTYPLLVYKTNVCSQEQHKNIYLLPLCILLLGGLPPKFGGMNAKD